MNMPLEAQQQLIRLNAELAVEHATKQLNLALKHATQRGLKYELHVRNESPTPSLRVVLLTESE